MDQVIKILKQSLVDTQRRLDDDRSYLESSLNSVVRNQESIAFWETRIAELNAAILRLQVPKVHWSDHRDPGS